MTHLHICEQLNQTIHLLQNISTDKKLDHEDNCTRAQKIYYITNYDQQTGLPNRTKFENQLIVERQNTIEAGLSIGLMIIKINDFWDTNDAFGYQIGDQLVIKVAKELKSIFSGSNLLFRYSTDRFVVILLGLDNSEQYDKLSREVLQLFGNPFKVGTYELDISVNLGVSFDTNHQLDTEQLIKQAEISILTAKKNGENTYVNFSPSTNLRNYQRFQLRNDIKHVLDKNQIEIDCQPIVKLTTGQILAGEALIRWKHPKFGKVMPNDFIEIAEETGFIINIGNWLLNQICKYYKRWQDNSYPAIKISLNYSGVQFYESNFVDNVLNTIASYGLKPDFLIMEITESILMKTSDKIISDIKKLQSHGIHIALDDFGTGFSSLAYLSSFPIDILKLDRSFIQKLNQDDANRIIVNSIIKMAQDLNIKLVAEGIENYYQLQQLQSLNCYTGQGYLYSRPIPIDDFEFNLSKITS